MARVRTIEDVKPVIGNLARPNYYEFDFAISQNPDLRAYLAARGVDSTFIQENVSILCSAAVLPGSNLASTESYNHVGLKENFAHTLQYDQLKLEFMCDRDMKTLKFFEHWIGFITSGSGILDTGNTNYYRQLRYPEEYKLNKSRIVKFENDNRSFDATTMIVKRYMQYEFVGLYPTDIYETPLQYGPDGGFMSVTVGFSFDRHIAGRTSTIDVINGFNNDLDANIKNTLDILNTGVGLVERIINI